MAPGHGGVGAIIERSALGTHGHHLKFWWENFATLFSNVSLVIAVSRAQQSRQKPVILHSFRKKLI